MTRTRHRLVVTVLALGTGLTTGPAVLAQRSGQVQVADLSPEAERSIQKGLRYLLQRQNADGSWGGEHRVAVTALTLAAFMVKGQFPEHPPQGRALSKGLDYLIRSAREGGGYMGRSMYEHGLATLALSEVWGMTRRGAEIRDILKRAVEVILRSQNRQGGWRYHPQPRDADISVTVMQIVALASAKEAGIVVPDEVIDKAIAYVKTCQNETSGGFGYQNPTREGFARTAAGVCSLLMCGDRSSDSVRRGLDYLRKTREKSFKERSHFYYGQFYAAQAMYQAGQSHYQEWYPAIRDTLIKMQHEDGRWSSDHGTPMSILILGVPYRFLPIYQR